MYVVTSYGEKLNNAIRNNILTPYNLEACYATSGFY